MGEPIPGSVPEEEMEKDEDESERVEYVSSSRLIDRVHQFGGHTRDIVDADTRMRINELQSRVDRFKNDLSVEEWNELMGLKTRANELMQAWLDKEMGGNSEKKPYVELTELIDNVHRLGGHTGDLISREDIKIINSLQAGLSGLDVAGWNRMMEAKQRAYEAMNQWVQAQ